MGKKINSGEIRHFIIEADGEFLKEYDRYVLYSFYGLDYIDCGSWRQYGASDSDCNPNWLVALKNGYNKHNKNESAMQEAKCKASEYVKDFLCAFESYLEDNFIVCVVPRLKLNQPNYLTDIVNSLDIADVSRIPLEDGRSHVYSTSAIVQVKNVERDQDYYPGITLDTCQIDREAIRGKNILLIDDIYMEHYRDSWGIKNKWCSKGLHTSAF
ncbi:hypothetical protein [Helicobacter sp. MIT 05-5294]|uniref:hypothetical protein n=1 Tax=Helicobacter sp. MIT 05-5294 TaxID=1548150 RepID=UPI000AEFAFF0|nr:hypothetical protein [Helicobacter sp. MIT 05-5294]TLD87820.1 hypothetical protein LS69_003225 [Helicobacter sp. MIT 05-5294]